MEVIKSNRGNIKLCLNGYMYVLQKECKSHIRWRCSKASSFKCRAVMITTIDRQNPEVRNEHNHASDVQSINVTKCYNAMKERAKDSVVQPVQIFTEGIVDLSDSTRARLPTEDSTKRTLRNQRSRCHPRTSTIEELSIEGDWCLTGGVRKERFLLYDNGRNAEHRVIIFATDECLQKLSNSTKWFMDGNFALAPSQFCQLYVIRVPVNGLFFTTVYCLLQRKNRSSYEEMFRVLLEKCAERNLFPDPSTVTIDFELAVMQAVKNVIGEDVTIQGCFYHLCQSTHRKVQELGLEVAYREDENFSLFCAMLDALAFLPVNDVVQGMDFIKRHTPNDEAKELVDYFDATYVSGTYRRVGNVNIGGPIRMRRVSPVFPPEVWNVHETTLADGERTNNQCEGWNHRFSNLVGYKHPTVWTLIKKMQCELAADETKLLQSRMGGVPLPKRKRFYQGMQRRLKSLCQQFAQGTIDVEQLLRGVGQNIRLRSDDQ